MKRIYLIDCPGIVYSTDDDETSIVLKGVIRVENLSNPVDYIPEVLNRVKPHYLANTYGVEGWLDAEDFLTMVAKKGGRLLKGGNPDLTTVSKMVLNDWLRGRIPFFTLPPLDVLQLEKEEEQGKKDVLGVVQKLDKIPIHAEFLPEDEIDVLMPSPPSMFSRKRGRDDVLEPRKKRKEEDWDELFGDVVGEEVLKPPSEPIDSGDSEESVSKESEESEEEKPSKEKRKTTNKQKVGLHYYKDANVKNRNRKTKLVNPNLKEKKKQTASNRKK
jgi:nuclear GTP-binding protein